MDSDIPAYVLPSHPKKPPVSKRNLFIGFGIILLVFIVILIAAAATLFFYRPFAEAVNARLLPLELQNAEFISRGSTGAYTYVDGRLLPGPYGAAVFYKDSPEEKLAITRTQEGSYGIEFNGSVVITSPEPILSVTLSPDGTQIAYARQLAGKDGSKAAEDFEVILFLPASGTSITVSPGFAPFFIDDSHLGRFTNAGIYSIDLANSTQTELLRQPFAQALQSFSQSPDRTLIAWSDPITKATYAFRVGESLERILSVPEYMPLLSLGNDALYRLRLTRTGTAVLRYPWGEGSSPRLLYWLSRSLEINSIVL